MCIYTHACIYIYIQTISAVKLETERREEDWGRPISENRSREGG